MIAEGMKCAFHTEHVGGRDEDKEQLYHSGALSINAEKLWDALSRHVTVVTFPLNVHGSRWGFFFVVVFVFELTLMTSLFFQ